MDLEETRLGLLCRSIVVGLSSYISLFLFVLVARSFKTVSPLATKSFEDIANAVHYCIMVYASLVLCDNQIEWWNNGYVYQDGAQFPDPSSMIICGAQIGSYLSMSVLVWLPPRKKDALLMTAHHLITSAIVTLCAFGGHAHACVTILLLHDVCDGPLLMMTSFGRFDFKVVETVCYCITVPLFAVCRVIFFPLVTAVAVYYNPNRTAVVVSSLNLVLLCMHCYWLSILLKQGYRRLKGLPTFDPRESETPTQPQPPKKDPKKKEN